MPVGALTTLAHRIRSLGGAAISPATAGGSRNYVVNNTSPGRPGAKLPSDAGRLLVLDATGRRRAKRDAVSRRRAGPHHRGSEAEHPRLRGEQRESILPEHRAATIAKVHAPRGRLYLKRQHIYDLGPDAVRFLTELVHRRPQTWATDVERLHALLLLRGDDALLTAIRAALAGRTIGSEYVAHLLGERERMSRLVVTGEEVAQ